MEIGASNLPNSSIRVLSGGVNNAGNTAGAANFASSLAAAGTAVKKADFVSGRFGVDLNSQGLPARVLYFDENGEQLTTSPFSAESILRNAQKFGIDLSDLRGLGDQLDTAGIGYKPYELYPGTGSDHGIDFDDLIAGGLGTAHDWTKDANISAKGRSALDSLLAAQNLAQTLKLEAHPEVTHNRGINGGSHASKPVTTAANETSSGQTASSSPILTVASESVAVEQSGSTTTGTTGSWDAQLLTLVEESRQTGQKPAADQMFSLFSNWLKSI